MKKHKSLTFVALSVMLVSVVSAFAMPANAYVIKYTGGNKGQYLHFHAWSGFAPETKKLFDLAFDEWNYKAGSVKPKSLWIDRSGTDTNQTIKFVNNKNEITKTYVGTGKGSYLMATNPTSIVLENGKYKLVEVDIDVNGSFPWDVKVRSGKYFVREAFTHEVGHVYGLDDVVNTSQYTGVKPTMWVTTDMASDVLCTIEEDDKAGLKAIYGD